MRDAMMGAAQLTVPLEVSIGHGHTGSGALAAGVHSRSVLTSPGAGSAARARPPCRPCAARHDRRVGRHEHRRTPVRERQLVARPTPAPGTRSRSRRGSRCPTPRSGGALRVEQLDLRACACRLRTECGRPLDRSAGPGWSRPGSLGRILSPSAEYPTPSARGSERPCSSVVATAALSCLVLPSGSACRSPGRARRAPASRRAARRRPLHSANSCDWSSTSCTPRVAGCRCARSSTRSRSRARSR